jgi:DNA-binding HxlR family transcriptional regulator
LARYTAAVAKSYNQYCPIAHALDVVGERWSLLVVRELIEHGPLRYSDLHANLAGCGTNILASRLKELERHGVVQRRRLEPPAASVVYELTEYGQELRAVLHVLAHWGARSLGRPGPDTPLEAGWLAGALRTAFPPQPDDLSVEFRIGDEVASLAGGDVYSGSVEAPEAVVEGDAGGFFDLVVERDRGGVSVSGEVEAVERLLASLPYPWESSARNRGPTAVANAAERS